MKIIKNLITTVILGAFFLTGSAFAYNAGNTGKDCKLPKFRDLNPPEKTDNTPVPEVEPEAEISFTVSGYADPTTIKAIAKKLKLDLTILDRNSFYQVTAKLPPELTGKYVRINLWAKAQSGPCVAKDGWLMKVKKAAEGVKPEAEKTTEE
jgi:hypothetical protein